MFDFEDHCSSTDPFTTTETTARESWYGIPGYPTVIFDGTARVEGAYADCASTAAAYRDLINQRLAATGGLSPVDITGTQLVSGGNVTMTGTFTLVDPVHLSNLRATLLLYEDAVEWCCGYGGVHTWNRVTRKIYDQNITLANVGDQVVVSHTYPVGAGWNAANLHTAVYLQNTTTKEIIQGHLVTDFSLQFAQYVDSAPNGNGTVTFRGTLRNNQLTASDFTLQIGSPFGSWATDFFVGDDPNPHTAPVQINLPAQGSIDIALRVRTDGTREIRSGSFEVTCLTTNRTDTKSFRVFNGSPAIMLVDNDGTQTSEVPIVHALDANGYLYDDWEVSTIGGTPSLRTIAGFDVVIWSTGGRASSTVLTEGDATTLKGFMDGGGSLFVTSNYYLNSLGGVSNAFVRDYLGVASWSVDKSYSQMNGVAGDVIGDGITLPLHFQYPSFAKGDDAVPGATATTDFLAPDNSHAMIRNTMASGSKSVFMPERFDAISETDPDPNNARTVLHRVIEWVKPATVDVDDHIGVRMLSAIGQVRPNPFSSGTEISFSVSSAAAGSPVRLEIYDLGGRMVASVVNDPMSAGTHLASWNGRTDAGAAAHTGIYFARLTTVEGIRSAKLLLVK